MRLKPLVAARLAMESVAACARIYWAKARFYASFATELAKKAKLLDLPPAPVQPTGQAG